MKFKLLLLSLVLSTAVIGQDTLTSEDVIVEVTTEIANDLSPVLDLIKKGEKPNDTAGWIMLIFTTLLPFITQFSVNKAKYSKLFEKVKSTNGGSKTIAFLISLLIGLGYEILESGIDFDSTDWAAASVIIYGAATLVHVIFQTLKPKKEIG
jgi:hypothetical protein